MTANRVSDFEAKDHIRIEVDGVLVVGWVKQVGTSTVVAELEDGRLFELTPTQVELI